MTYLTFPNRTRPIKATEAVLDRITHAAALGLKGDALALAAGMLPNQLEELLVNDREVEMIIRRAKYDKVVALASRLDAASAAGDTKATMTLLNKLTDGEWEPKQSATPFGAGGITINITSVKPNEETFVEREPVDQ